MTTLKDKQKPEVTLETLKKDIRTLQCLYDVARITGEAQKTLEERFREIVNVIPMGFEHPECVYCRITVEEKEFLTSNYRKSSNNVHTNIKFLEDPIGRIEVGCRETPSCSQSCQFTREAKALVASIAERLQGIIEHRWTDNAWRESEEKFSKAFHASPAIISITSLEDGCLIDVNESFERYSGFSREDAIGRTTLETGRWVKPEERRRFLALLAKQGKVRDMEISSYTKSGELRTGLISADVINLSGKPCILSVTQDITEQKRSETLLKNIYDASPLGIFITHDNAILYSNPQFQEITGYSQAEILNLNIYELIVNDDIDVVRSCLIRSRDSNTAYPCEYRLIHKNGPVKWVMQTVSSITYEGKEAILGNIMDITERKFLERKVVEYEELDKLKRDFMATVSHELRTPIATIKGNATMLVDYFNKISPSELKQTIKSMDKSTDVLISLVDDLLDTTRLDAGLFTLFRAPTNIINLIKGVIASAANHPDGHRIITRLPKTLPRITLDARRIGQVLENLISNAAKYSPPGTNILITAGQTGNEVWVRVSDYGAGIPAAELDSIFDRMFKPDKKAYSDADGMGLSLHICQRIIEAHGGRIWAESKLGEGSTIQFTIPLNAVKNTGGKM